VVQDRALRELKRVGREHVGAGTHVVGVELTDHVRPGQVLVDGDERDDRELRARSRRLEARASRRADGAIGTRSYGAI